MKSIIKLVITCFTISLFLSCSEDDDDFARAATIKVINLINGEDNVIVKTGDNPINYATTQAKVEFGDFKNFSISEGASRQFEVVAESDTLNLIYNETLNLKGIHSLYLSGTSGEKNTFFIEDNIKQFTDSLVAIRFINLSKLSGPIGVSIVESGNEVVTGLNEDSGTEYIEFPVKETDGNYTFEFKDSSGDLLNTYAFNPLENNNETIKKNFTLVLYDFQINSFITFQRVTRINNY